MEDQGVVVSGSMESKLIEGDSFIVGSKDVSMGGGSEVECSDGEFGVDQYVVVVGDGVDNDDGVFVIFGDVGCNVGEGDGRVVGFRYKQVVEDDFVEVGVGVI